MMHYWVVARYRLTNDVVEGLSNVNIRRHINVEIRANLSLQSRNDADAGEVTAKVSYSN